MKSYLKCLLWTGLVAAVITALATLGGDKMLLTKGGQYTAHAWGYLIGATIGGGVGFGVFFGTVLWFFAMLVRLVYALVTKIENKAVA